VLYVIGRLIEYYRIKYLKETNDKKYRKTNFIKTYDGSNICSRNSYQLLCNGKLLKKLEYYEKLTKNLDMSFYIYSNYKEDDYYEDLEKFCLALQEHSYINITTIINYFKIILRDRDYIGYQELYQSIILIESIIYGKFIPKSLSITKIEAIAVCISNHQFKLTLLYFLYFYYNNYVHDTSECNRILTELYNYATPNDIQTNIYCKYANVVYLNNVARKGGLATIRANEWYQTENKAIYESFLAIKAYEFTIHGESSQVEEIIDEGQKHIKKNWNYFFSDLESGMLYHQLGSHLYLMGKPERSFYELKESIKNENIISHVSTILLIMIINSNNNNDYVKYRLTLKNLKFKKSSGISLFIKCLDLVHIDKSYKRAQQLILQDLFKYFVISKADRLISEQFKILLTYCVEKTGDHHLTTEYLKKEREILYPKENIDRKGRNKNGNNP